MVMNSILHCIRLTLRLAYIGCNYRKRSLFYPSSQWAGVGSGPSGSYLRSASSSYLRSASSSPTKSTVWRPERAGLSLSRPAIRCFLCWGLFENLRLGGSDMTRGTAATLRRDLIHPQRHLLLFLPQDIHVSFSCKKHAEV